MIARVCPRCGSRWYSADTRDWICEECRELLTDKNNVDILDRN